MSKGISKRYYKDEPLLSTIGSKIREIRLSKNISQEALANECGIDYSQLNRMELGKVNFSISYLYKIAKVLQVDPRDLHSNFEGIVEHYGCAARKRYHH